MTDLPPTKALLAVALLFLGAGLVLAEQAWVSSPRLHVPPGIAYVLAGVSCTAALMIAFQVFGVRRWNDLLAAVLLLGVTVETLWLTFGSGPRPCLLGWWRPLEGACRALWGVGVLVSGAMMVWAIRRYVARRGSGE